MIIIMENGRWIDGLNAIIGENMMIIIFVFTQVRKRWSVQSGRF